MRTTLRILIPVVVAAAAGACSLPGGAPGSLSPAARLPNDSTVKVGRLPNGLTYYVRANAEPRKRAELRLVLDAGSILEDDDQRGLAHFVEHMAFNGTRRFERQEIVNFLESVGMRFGPDVNAYTSFDETVYMLTLPTDTAGVLEKGLDILEDWATAVSFDPTEVDKERGVVVEEWRLGRGAGARLQDRHFGSLFARSRYASRLPIGERQTLESFPVSALKRFYADWYRPDLMAVVAVGDFDAGAMERMIRQRFGKIPRREERRARPRHELPASRRTRFSVAADPEATATTVTVVHTTLAEDRRTVGEYREGVVESLFTGVLADRLNELTLRPGAPFLDVSSASGALVRPASAFFLTARVPDGGAARGLGALLTEAERAARHGFTGPELEREKAELLRAWEQIHAERRKSTSAQFAGQYVGHFLYGGALLTVEEEYRLHQALVPGITAREVGERARAWLAARNRAVLVSAPERADLPLPDSTALLAVVDSVRRAPVAAYTEEVSEAPLLARLPAPGRVVEERTHPEVGVTEWRLSNGARVLLKPTDFRADEIVLAGRSPGGTSLLGDADHLGGVRASAAAQVGGVGELSVGDLSKRLAGKSAVVGTDVGELSEGISGYASPRDVETMFQLAYLYFTAPRRDTVAWEAYRERARESFRGRGASPQAAFGDTLQATLTQRHPRARPLTPESFDSLSLDRALEIYRERFADAGDFTFFLVGSFDPDSIRPLVERYLGGLPSTGRAESWRDLGVRPPVGVVRKTVRRGMEPQSRTQLVFSGELPFERRNVALLRALADALELRLRERLREDLGGTYGVGVGASALREPRPEYRLAVEFGAAPERLDELVRVVFAEIDSLKAKGPSELDLVKVREAQRRDQELRLRENDFWLAALMQYVRNDWDFRGIVEPPLSGAFTPADVRDAARLFLDTGRYVQVSLYPERAEEAAGAAGARP